MKSIRKIMTLAGVVALVVGALPASAAQFTISQFNAAIPAGASDELSVYNAAGNRVGDATSFEPESPNVIREVNTDLANPLAIGNYYLINDANGNLSDIVGVEHAFTVVIVGGVPVITPHAEFAYVSDPLTLSDWVGPTKAFDGALLGTLTESDPFGITVDISLLINPAGGAAGGTAYFHSDGNVPDGGTTVILLGMVLTGLGAARRWMKQ